MKKQLFGVALSALLLSTAAEARSFDGAFVGANMGYKWEHLKTSAFQNDF
jgi:opacity protein-like surface antigen